MKSRERLVLFQKIEGQMQFLLQAISRLEEEAKETLTLLRKEDDNDNSPRKRTRNCSAEAVLAIGKFPGSIDSDTPISSEGSSGSRDPNSRSSS